MMQRILCVLVVGLFVGCESGTPNAPTGAWPDANESLEEQVLDLVNQRRAQGATCGGDTMPPVPALSAEPALTEAARQHSYDMVVRDFFSHTNPSGQNPGDRIEAQGYEWSTWGENIAGGQSTAAAVMQSWMGSAGHCRNIMSASFTEIGIGVYENQWTQVFGRPL